MLGDGGWILSVKYWWCVDRGKMLYWANKSNKSNRANAFVITADEFNKPNYLLVEINGLDRANLVISG